MADIPLPSTGSTSWTDWASEQEDMSDLARTAVQNASGVARIQVITAAAYAALGTKVSDTLYVISG